MLAYWLTLFMTPELGAGDYVLSSRTCPAIFGTTEQRRDNKKHRVKTLLQVDAGPFTIDLLQAADWSEPQPVRLRGARLAETSVDAHGSSAIVRIQDRKLPCAPGRYQVVVDDMIGPLRVLAILPDLVLVEQDSALYYIATGNDRTPVFRLTWQAPFRLRRQAPSTVHAAPAANIPQPPVRR